MECGSVQSAQALLREAPRRLPVWLRKAIPSQSALLTRSLLEDLHLNTVCQSARCPNITECFSQRRSTFMILGNRCTRWCGYCAIDTLRPDPPDPGEPERVAEAARRMALRHVVVTSVARDDLADGGAAHFCATIRAIRRANPSATVEVLIPDFAGEEPSLRAVLAERPDVLNHNIETVRGIFKRVRPKGGYDRTLELLARAKVIAPDQITKSGFMLGLGELREEVEQTLQDLRAAGVDMVTIGQYMKPKEGKVEVVEYIEPRVFEDLETRATALGFAAAFAGPFVRSSYHAEEVKDKVFR